jgi:hypothetical protein
MFEKTYDYIAEIKRDKNKQYGGPFCNINEFDVHTAITQDKIVELLAALLGKVEDLETVIKNLPFQTQQVAVEPVAVATEEPTPAPTTKTTTRKTATKKTTTAK